MSNEIPESVRHVFEGATGKVVEEWRDNERWHVVTITGPAFEGASVRLEFRAPEPAEDG